MKAIKVTLALATAMFLFGVPGAQAQENGAKHELSAAIQGLGLGSMPFRGGAVSWDDQPGFSLGFNVGYTYWFGEHLGFRTGVRLASLSHNQMVSNLDLAYSSTMTVASGSLPGGSGPTTVNLHGTAGTIQEEQQYTYLELPLQLAMRFGGLFANVGLSLSKAVSATADYSYNNPALEITALPDLGTTPVSPIAMNLTGVTEKNVKNLEMSKPFYCLLDAEAGYTFPLGGATDLAVGLFGRFAPIAHKTDNSVDLYSQQSGLNFVVNQPATAKQVERVGYYEVGVLLGVNFGLNKKASAPAQPEALMAPADNRYDRMTAELAAMKAAQQKSESEIAAMKANQKKTEEELAAMKAAKKKTEEELAAMKAAQEKASSELTSMKASALRQPSAGQQQVSQPAASLHENAQRRLDDLGATIYFDFKSAKVKPTAEEEGALQAICEAMKADRKMKVVVTGHTDDRGSARTNQTYGMRRARALKLYMVNLGAPAANIKCESKGEKEPVADNATDEGRTKNRRATVELR